MTFFRTLCLTAASIGLLSCSDNSTVSTAPASSTTPAAPTTQTTPHAEQTDTLDLSLPEVAIDVEQIETVQQDKSLADDTTLLPDLFEKQAKEKKLSISGKPTLEMGETTDKPNVTGGEVDVELKIP